ncbi:Mitochondrial carrier protein [Actinidia chinensis var. chinensis]|uniref:Mitochondrial carrier protein n=1 Tax=Actinidia chinensis var. chinensis TaxID=1590841 RepID=A0A2R6R9N7_ACTCC|nr:Mitochondrial carrier protein [Actinidia chinensis var. chinensis]
MQVEHWLCLPKKTGGDLLALLLHFPQLYGRIHISECSKHDTLCPLSCWLSGTVISLYHFLPYSIELARTHMQAFKEAQNGVNPTGVWKTLAGVTSPVRGTNNIQNLQSYSILWTGLGAPLARDIPFFAICWSTLEPVRFHSFKKHWDQEKNIGLIGDETSAANVLGANLCAGFVAGTIAAATTYPLDVSKTRWQIQDHTRALKMTTK